MLALLQVSVQEGGIQCSDAGQYECVVGLNPEAGTVRSISVNITIIGEDCQLMDIYNKSIIVFCLEQRVFQ